MKPFVLLAALALGATPASALSLKSQDVSDGKPFAARFVCPKYQGGNVSPELSWSGVPSGTKSLAITMFDPDAGPNGYWHWLLVDLPPTAKSLAQGAGSTGGSLPAGAMRLPNSAGQDSYAGPCPPPGKVHHYQITLYALPVAKAAVTTKTSPAEVGAYLAKNAIATARITPVYESK